MANTEKSKLKLLYLYYYFDQLGADPTEAGRTMGEILSYLSEKTGNDFERKSIYADIDRLNEFARSVDMVDAGTDWITLESRKYLRGEIKNELTLDEARLIVDAINATDFIDSGLCEKIKKMYPNYFKKDYNSVVPHDDRKVQRISSTTSLNMIRTAIDEGYVLGFKYGYIVAGGIRGDSDRKVSPIALDFENSHYYIIAVDNDAVDKGTDRKDAIKRYRIDRMKEFRLLGQKGYLGFGKDKDKILNRYLKDSVDAFASSDSRNITITLECDNTKELLKAFSGLAEDVKIRIISDELERGRIKFLAQASLVPPFFNILFRLSLYEGVKITIEDEEVVEMYEQYLTRARKSLNK